jgi:hypothetical protein
MGPTAILDSAAEGKSSPIVGTSIYIRELLIISARTGQIGL